MPSRWAISTCGIHGGGVSCSSGRASVSRATSAFFEPRRAVADISNDTSSSTANGASSRTAGTAAASCAAHCLCRRLISLRITAPAPRARAIWCSGTSSSSPTVDAPNDWATDTARGDSPAASSGVSRCAAWAAASRDSSSERGSSPTVTGVVAGAAASDTRNTSRHAACICAHRVEPAVHVAVQGPPEEGDQLVAQRRLEQLGGDRRRLVGGGARVRDPVTPHGPRARGHLVQRHRGRVPLRVVVEHRTARRAQERVEVAAGAGRDVALGGLGEREVEQHQLLGAVGPLEDREVVGLEVAVAHAPRGELVQRDGTGRRRSARAGGRSAGPRPAAGRRGYRRRGPRRRRTAGPAPSAPPSSRGPSSLRTMTPPPTTSSTRASARSARGLLLVERDLEHALLVHRLTVVGPPRAAPRAGPGRSRPCRARGGPTSRRRGSARASRSAGPSPGTGSGSGVLLLGLVQTAQEGLGRVEALAEVAAGGARTPARRARR